MDPKSLSSNGKRVKSGMARANPSRMSAETELELLKQSGEYTQALESRNKDLEARLQATFQTTADLKTQLAKLRERNKQLVAGSLKLFREMEALLVQNDS